MKRILIILSILVTIQVNQVFSQFDQSSSFIRQNEIDAAKRAFPKLVYEKVSGSPYYSKNFVNAKLTRINGDTGTIPMRYDLFQDEMEFKVANKILWLTKKDIKSIIYENETLVVSPVFGDTSKLGIFFLETAGKFSLYAKNCVAYRPFVPPKPYGDAIPERFENTGLEFYLKTENMPARIFRTKKVLLGLFNNDKAVVDFVKKEKINVDNLDDLKKLFSFLNSR
jgi:hypothetical protein